MRLRIRLVWITAAALLLMVGVASAHTPIFLPEGKGAGIYFRAPVTDPERSWALYGRLAQGGVDLIPIEARAGQKLYAQLLVPGRSAGSFRPRAVLLGPGLPEKPPGELPVIPGVKGALSIPALEKPRPFFEPFTQTHYQVLAEVTGTYPVSGRYVLAVYEPSSKGGAYTVAVGEREEFGLRDLLSFPRTWLKVRRWARP